MPPPRLPASRDVAWPRQGSAPRRRRAAAGRTPPARPRAVSAALRTWPRVGASAARALRAALSFEALNVGAEFVQARPEEHRLRAGLGDEGDQESAAGDEQHRCDDPGRE